jgi:hypothetical protein
MNFGLPVNDVQLSNLFMGITFQQQVLSDSASSAIFLKRTGQGAEAVFHRFYFELGTWQVTEQRAYFVAGVVGDAARLCKSRNFWF